MQIIRHEWLNTNRGAHGTDPAGRQLKISTGGNAGTRCEDVLPVPRKRPVAVLNCPDISSHCRRTGLLVRKRPVEALDVDGYPPLDVDRLELVHSQGAELLTVALEGDQRLDVVPVPLIGFGEMRHGWPPVLGSEGPATPRSMLGGSLGSCSYTSRAHAVRDSVEVMNRLVV